MMSCFLYLIHKPEIEVLVNPFITAYQNDAMEQLEGQVASAKIGMARLASPQLYWVLYGNDFTLDINNPIILKLFAWEIIQRSNKCMELCYLFIFQD